MVEMLGVSVGIGGDVCDGDGFGGNGGLGVSKGDNGGGSGDGCGGDGGSNGGDLMVIVCC